MEGMRSRENRDAYSFASAGRPGSLVGACTGLCHSGTFLTVLETAAAQTGNPVDGWLSPVLVQQRLPTRVHTLADLHRRIVRGGR